MILAARLPDNNMQCMNLRVACIMSYLSEFIVLGLPFILKVPELSGH